MNAVSVDTVLTPGGVALVLRRLAAGEEIVFFDRDMGGRDTVRFTLRKVAGSYELRSAGVLTTTTSFAEAWRSRPRVDCDSGGVGLR